MSLIAEFEVDSPIMQETARAVPNMVFRTEELHVSPEGEGTIVFWAAGDELDQMGSALQADSTIRDYQRLTTLDDRRLYRVTLSSEGMKAMTYPAAAEYDIQFLDVAVTNEGSQIRARVPTRDALKAFQEACEDRDLPFRLQRVYHEDPDDLLQEYGLTEKQHDVLVRAHELGYFETPRRITLEELAEEFGISRSALGRRLRRAQDVLIDATLRQPLARRG